MHTLLPHLGAWLDSPWVVPVIGGVACAVVYFAGRLLLVSSPPVAETNESIEPAFLGGVTRDRRAAPRRRGNTVEVQLRLSAEQEPLRAWVVDRSIGGLGLLVDAPVSKGVPVQLRPMGDDTIPWTDATIRSCRPEGSQYEVGIQFHRTPNWSMMLQFG